MTLNAFTALRARSDSRSTDSAGRVAVGLSDATRRCPGASKDYWSFSNALPVGVDGRAPCPVCGRSIAVSSTMLGEKGARIPVHHKTKPAKSEH